jgi:hypothetical protein
MEYIYIKEVLGGNVFFNIKNCVFLKASGHLQSLFLESFVICKCQSWIDPLEQPCITLLWIHLSLFEWM